MKKRLPSILFILCLSVSVRSQYISKILEYKPAPSQYMNSAPWGTPSSPETLIGGINGTVSLGAFGGYIIFKFEDAVENDPGNPYGVDFTIFGNPVLNWSEPGIVSVMKDENKNGLADDKWYLLAGSDHFFSTTIKKYEVSYEYPSGQSTRDIPWNDNFGNSGIIKANSYYTQSYYPLPDSFPSIDTASYKLSGELIKSTVDTSSHTQFYSVKKPFGYADNNFRGKKPYTLPDNPYTEETENSGGDAFDISWAVDDDGNYIELDEVDFIKVHTAVMNGAGWLGQLSTEITGAVDVVADRSVKGVNEMLLIREIPAIIDTNAYQLEVFAYKNGRINYDEAILWSSTMPGATVDEENILHLNQSGELILTATLASNDEIHTTVSTSVQLSISSEENFINDNILIYPNPADNFVIIKGSSFELIRIMDLSGKTLIQKEGLSQNSQIEISTIPSGIYILHIVEDNRNYTTKLIKK